MTNYSFGPDKKPVGPELHAASDEERRSIDACIDFFSANAERMKYFAGRVAALGRSGADTVITLIDVDDPSGNGELLADILMPGHDWQQNRDRGEPAVAKGLVAKESFPGFLEELGYTVAARALTETDDLRVIVLHAGTIQVMDVQY